MSDLANFPDLDWALNYNSDMKIALSTLYSKNQRYLGTLNELVSELRQANCSGVQEKMRDANHLDKLEATIAEMRIGRFLSQHGKRITFLTDSYMGH